MRSIETRVERLEHFTHSSNTSGHVLFQRKDGTYQDMFGNIMSEEDKNKLRGLKTIFVGCELLDDDEDD